MDKAEGVQFAAVDGRRSSQHAGKAILADAVRAVDADLASRIEQTSDWRKRYIDPFTGSVIAGARSAKDALRVAQDGLDSVHDHLTFVRGDQELRLDEAFTTLTDPLFRTEVVEGQGEQVAELEVPYQGQTLRGQALIAQLDRWVEAQVVEPSARDALKKVVENPAWLDLSDRWIALLGASSEMGPLGPLCAWGANLLAVDLPRPHLWEHITNTARAGSGTLHAPVRQNATGDVVGSAGADLLTEAPEVATWLRGFDAPFTVGNYVYADGTNFVRLASGVDALITNLLASRSDLSVAYLATPTDVFAVSEEIARGARDRAKGSFVGPLRAISRSKLYAKNYAELISSEDGPSWGISDSLVPIQGPNYALSKALQRWRALVARENGTTSSANVAPASNTASVTKNKMLAAVYRGAPAFGIEIFEPATTRVLMAALLVHDLQDPNAAANPAVKLDHPFELFVQGAIHGGIWRLPYQPRSILPLGLVGGYFKRS